MHTLCSPLKSAALVFLWVLQFVPKSVCQISEIAGVTLLYILLTIKACE